MLGTGLNGDQFLIEFKDAAKEQIIRYGPDPVASELGADPNVSDMGAFGMSVKYRTRR